MGPGADLLRPTAKASSSSQRPYIPTPTKVGVAMNAEFFMFCELDPVETGFVPTVRIILDGEEVFAWRCSFAFSDASRALVYGRDYGEVALQALKARR